MIPGADQKDRGLRGWECPEVLMLTGKRQLWNHGNSNTHGQLVSTFHNILVSVAAILVVKLDLCVTFGQFQVENPRPTGFRRRLGVYSAQIWLVNK